MGHIIAGSGDEECIIWAEIEREFVLTARKEFPTLKDCIFQNFYSDPIGYAFIHSLNSRRDTSHTLLQIEEVLRTQGMPLLKKLKCIFSGETRSLPPYDWAGNHYSLHHQLRLSYSLAPGDAIQ